jgi:hypothetical protein
MQGHKWTWLRVTVSDFAQRNDVEMIAPLIIGVLFATLAILLWRVRVEGRETRALLLGIERRLGQKRKLGR